jgi:hypothetical protein
MAARNKSKRETAQAISPGISTPQTESQLWQMAAKLPFQPHRIRMDQTGRYDEALDREFPFVVRLFHFRHKDYTPGWTWHERLEVFVPLDGVTRMRMGEQESSCSREKS